jgi:hypothetical protein
MVAKNNLRQLLSFILDLLGVGEGCSGGHQIILRTAHGNTGGVVVMAGTLQGRTGGMVASRTSRRAQRDAIFCETSATSCDAARIFAVSS